MLDQIVFEVTARQAIAWLGAAFWLGLGLGYFRGWVSGRAVCWVQHMKRGKPPKSVSDKRLAESDARWEVRAAALARDRYCVAELLVPEIECGGQLDVDEIAPRGVCPGGHLELDNVQVLCRRHHDWKHAHPEEAHRRGLRRWSWEQPV